MITDNRKPSLAVTMGDPAGIGPEIMLKAIYRKKELLPPCNLTLVGDLDVLSRAEKALSQNLPTISRAFNDQDDVKLLDLDNINPDRLSYGEVQAKAGQASMEYIRKAISLAKKGEVDGIVTGPINKESLHLSGHTYPGHTEILAEATDAEDVAMMMAHDDFRVVVISTHMSLSKAVKKVEQDRIETCIKLTNEALTNMGIETPSIGVAGLNPHAGESGLFGKEEINEIDPAIESSLKEGINVSGPRPPDTIFTAMKDGEFDAVISMYHDQGLTPFKLLSFLKNSAGEKKVEGVNVTLGLPFVRTSVDHGVAYDIVGEGTASPHSLIEALELAVKLSES